MLSLGANIGRRATGGLEFAWSSAARTDSGVCRFSVSFAWVSRLPTRVSWLLPRLSSSLTWLLWSARESGFIGRSAVCSENISSGEQQGWVRMSTGFQDSKANRYDLGSLLNKQFTALSAAVMKSSSFPFAFRVAWTVLQLLYYCSILSTVSRSKHHIHELLPVGATGLRSD